MKTISKGSREAFRSLIDTLKDRASKEGIEVTDKEIAENLGITLTAFRTFYNND